MYHNPNYPQFFTLMIMNQFHSQRKSKSAIARLICVRQPSDSRYQDDRRFTALTDTLIAKQNIKRDTRWIKRSKSTLNKTRKQINTLKLVIIPMLSILTKWGSTLGQLIQSLSHSLLGTRHLPVDSLVGEPTKKHS